MSGILCIIVVYAITVTLLLAGAFGLCVLAQRRAFAPSLPAALAVGLALRAVVWWLAAAQSWQPYDFLYDFPAAGAAVLHHHDPMLSGRSWGWPFLPTMAYVLAAELKLGQAAHLQWQVVGRLAPVLADLALIPLVGRLARTGAASAEGAGAACRGALRRFQYACNPISIMVCAIHGQLEPEMLALGVAALLVARSSGRGTGAGALLGLSVAIGNWSALLAPGILAALPALRQRLRASAMTVAVPVAVLLTAPLATGSSIRQLAAIARGLAGLRPVIGTWGWTAIVTRGSLQVEPVVGRIGAVALLAALVVAGYLWRRADPIDLTSALLLTFLLVSPRFGGQYLMWPIPYLVARPSRYTMPAVAAAASWLAFGYLTLGRHYSWAHDGMWYVSSWYVIPLLALALPWASRGARGEFTPRPPAGEQAMKEPLPESS